MIRKIAFALALTLLPVASIAQQSPPPSSALPDTRAGKALGAWLTAFDSGDAATYKAFLQAQFPAELKSLNDDMQFRQMTGGFDLRSIESSTPTKIVAILEDRNNGQFARLTLTVTQSTPYQITDLPILAIHTPAQFAPPHLSESELVAAARARVEEAAQKGLFSGTVLVAHDGKPIYTAANGLADRAKGVPITLDTRFRIGSMNKMFTAVGIMQLVQAGKVRLDAPLRTYVPDYPNKQLASEVTIAELLTHTGGTGDIFGPAFDSHRMQLRSPSDYVKLYGTRAPAFKPGSRFDYSNYGFVLLGVVIERVSHQSYYDYVQQHVFAPAGMTSTGSDPEDDPVSGRSIGYTRDDNGAWQLNTDTLPYRGSPAGGGYSTVGDLLRFADALLANKLLNATYTQLLTTGKVDMPGGMRYAYGFGDERVNGVRCFGHNGGAPGQNGDLEICPQTGYVVTALSNFDPPAASSISDFITARLPLP